ncbi:Tetratricopeptide repeat domain 19 [Carabus blaptoides fortunei]
MNSVIKLYRYTLSNKNILQRLYQPIRAVQNVNLNKAKLCNNSKSTSQNKVPKSRILLCVSLLTWLGFTQDDEDKESELIMTIKRAILCTQREEWTKAEQMLHLALRLAQEQQNEQGVLYVYDIMANLALERGETDKAEMLFVNVLQRLLSGGMKQEDIKVIHISLKLARICHMKDDIEKAEIGFQWCLDSLKKNHLASNNQDAIALYGVVQDWYAQLLLDTGKVNEALKHLKDAHRICSQQVGEQET